MKVQTRMPDVAASGGSRKHTSERHPYSICSLSEMQLRGLLFEQSEPSDQWAGRLWSLWQEASDGDRQEFLGRVRREYLSRRRPGLLPTKRTCPQPRRSATHCRRNGL